MRAGSLRHVITLQSLVQEQDAYGQAGSTWVNGPEVHADIRYLSGLETVRAEASVAVTRASIRIRFRADVVPSMRVVHGAKVYDIKAVLPDPTNARYLDLVAETGAKQD